MELDLDKLRRSDLVIINFNDMYSLGSMAELAIAYEKRIPVIGLNIDRQVLHPWQECMCNRIFNDIDELLDYVEDFYLVWKEGRRIISCNVTSHALARELLSKPDGFITAMYGEDEYVSGNRKRVATHANMDDSVMHWALQLKDCPGNIVRWIRIMSGFVGFVLGVIVGFIIAGCVIAASKG